MAVVEGYNFIKATFNGRNGEGVVSLPGIKAGDRMFWQSVAGNYDFDNSFEKIISNDDEIYQNATGDKSAQSIVALFIRI